MSEAEQLEVIELMVANTKEHPFESVVIDTLDWLEPLIWKKLISEGKSSRPDRPPKESKFTGGPLSTEQSAGQLPSNLSNNG